MNMGKNRQISVWNSLFSSLFDTWAITEKIRKAGGEYSEFST